jgi:hypothetical protein
MGEHLPMRDPGCERIAASAVFIPAPLKSPGRAGRPRAFVIAVNDGSTNASAMPRTPFPRLLCCVCALAGSVVAAQAQSTKDPWTTAAAAAGPLAVGRRSVNGECRC